MKVAFRLFDSKSNPVMEKDPFGSHEFKQMLSISFADAKEGELVSRNGKQYEVLAIEKDSFGWLNGIAIEC